MSDLTIPEHDPHPQDCTCRTPAVCYCYDNGHEWQENCPPETNHKPNCRCGYFCTVCGAIDR